MLPLLLAVGGCHRSSKRPLPITINEIMAGGAARPLATPDGELLVDAEGQPADWVEIYNPLSQPVNLAGYSLTDNPDKPRKFRFPSLVLSPGQFLVVVVDGNPEAGPLHTSFRLGAKGEAAYLFADRGRVMVDRKTYVDMEPNVTAGLYPDGHSAEPGPGGEEYYGLIYVPTPGKPNKRIGIKPPRFQDLPRVSPEASPEDPELVPVTFTVLEDSGVDIQRTLLERERAADCNRPIVESGILPGSGPAAEGARSAAPAEMRRSVFGVLTAKPQVTIPFVAYIPREPDGTLLHLRTTVENEIGAAVQIYCHCAGSQVPPVVNNEYVPINHQSLLLDEYDRLGALIHPRKAPDWIELYNDGDQPVSLGDYELIGHSTYQARQSPNPPPNLFLWRFRDVGLDVIQPHEHFLILADGDKPYEFDALGNLILGPDKKPIPAFRSYARAGQSDRRYRSTNFKISGGDKRHPDQDDSFHLLSPQGLVVDSARFNFSDQVSNGEKGEIEADRAFGRLPDAANRGISLTHLGGADGGGQFLNCPTPEAPNAAACDVLPRFEQAVWTEPRCPGPGNTTQITAFVNIDEDTALADSPQDPRFELELSYTAGSQTTVLDRRDQRLVVRRPTENEIGIYKPAGVPGSDLFLVRTEIPGQPAGTLVVFSLRARDPILKRDHPELCQTPLAPPGVSGDCWVEHSERVEPKVAFRLKSGYQKPRLAFNEIYANAEPTDPPLLYGPEKVPIPSMDYVEIYNDSAEPVDLAGMWLDDENYPAGLGPQGRVRKFEFPGGSVIEPHRFLCLFFPKTDAEAGQVPSGALAVNSLGLDDCKEALFLLAPDADGNCVVAEAQWNIETTRPGPDGDVVFCPPGVAVGMVPDGVAPEPGPTRPNLNQLDRPSPCASNCGARIPEFAAGPIHSALTNPNVMECVEPGDIVLIKADVRIDAYAAAILPPPVVGSPTGVEKAELLVRKGDQETVQTLDKAAVTQTEPHDRCLVLVRLNGQIRPPHTPVVFYQVRVKDGNGNTVESEWLSFGVAGTKPPLAINEVMARNSRTYADDHGNFPPWIELYNGGAQPADFGGMFLTDVRAEPRKWQFPRIPATVVPPRGFLIVFADGDETPGDLHASVRLNDSGPGDLFLLDKPENGTCIIDSFHYDFTGLPPDTSIGRIPDGTGSPVVLPFPTPGGPNSGGIFLRADVIQNDRVNVSDMAWLFQVLLEHAPAPSCLDILDVNDDGVVDTRDGLYLGNYLFLGGPSIPPPFPDRGTDPTPDDLPCS